MRHAYCNHEMVAPLGVEPQLSKDEITIESYDGSSIIPINDLQQLNELRALLDAAAEILGWEHGRSTSR